MTPGIICVLTAFVLCSAVDIVAAGKGCVRAERIAKPLLMPLLLAFYLLSAKTPNLFLVLALVGGFLGDTFLLGSGVFFACGLLSFLLGHLFYITAFLRPLDFSALPPLLWISALLLYLLYSIPVCRHLMPFVEPKVRPAVVLYMICLLGMSFASLLRYQYASGVRFWLPFVGSLLFVASDTMLAFHVFRKKSGENSGVAVMITYLLAQFLIVSGFLP